MKINELDLKGYGSFSNKEKAVFTINTLNLPTSWDYIYQNRNILLRVDQFGIALAQAFPPSDIMMCMRDRSQKYSVWHTWFMSEDFEKGAFTNFFRPLPGEKNPAKEPDRVEITFKPSHAEYLIENEGLRVETTIFVPSVEPAVCQNIRITNLKNKKIKLKALPVLRPACMRIDMAPWDKPEWYLRTGLFKDEDRGAGFHIHMTSPTCDISSRRGAVLWSSKENLTGAEVSLEKFVGQGSFDNPESVNKESLELTMEDAQAWMDYGETNNIFAYPPACALMYEYELQPGESKEINQVFSWLKLEEKGTMPGIEVARELSIYLDSTVCKKEIQKQDNMFSEFASIRKVQTPDEVLNQYVNEWLPLQLDWVCSLDRGHPSGMRGGRDCANDFTAMLPLDTGWTRQIILTQLSCQRGDGWCPRHFSSKGHAGKERDTRNPLDAGAWVIEMVYEYLCHTKDFAILDEKLPWLNEDASKRDTVLEHLIRALEFFIKDENLGEHGIIKIGEGEWLDTVNNAGSKGRGEGVMLTNQVIMCIVWMKGIVTKPGNAGKLDENKTRQLVQEYDRKVKSITENLNKYAYNKEGYYNGFFNDDGHWLFSPEDPDGVKRIYGPASWWSLASGAAIPDKVESCLKQLDFLKCDAGYRLDWPPFIYGTVDHVGRMASGDSPAGRAEHGNAYNQGSHGFLGRGLAAAGKGDLLYQSIIYLLPYDQEVHPVEAVMNPPYAVLNVWEEIPRFMNRGKNTFLTGSIGYGLRMVYDWMLGIQPTLDGLAIDPCLPADFHTTNAEFIYLGKPVKLEIYNPNGNQAGVRSLELNGMQITRSEQDPFSKRIKFVIDDHMLREEGNIIIAEI